MKPDNKPTSPLSTSSSWKLKLTLSNENDLTQEAIESVVTINEMSKVVFNPDESVLRQWEQMHRPPDTIPTSGPQFPRVVGFGNGPRQQQQVELI